MHVYVCVSEWKNAALKTHQIYNYTSVIIFSWPIFKPSNLEVGS